MVLHLGNMAAFDMSLPEAVVSPGKGYWLLLLGENLDDQQLSGSLFILQVVLVLISIAV